MDNYTIEDKERDEFTKEFPPLTQEAGAVFDAAMFGLDTSKPYWSRRFAAALLLEAVKISRQRNSQLYDLELIAKHLHNVAPPPPTKQETENALKNLLGSLAYESGSWLDMQAKILQRGIAHHFKVQP